MSEGSFTGAGVDGLATPIHDEIARRFAQEATPVVAPPVPSRWARVLAFFGLADA